MKYKRIFLYSFIPALLLFFLASIWYYRLPFHKDYGYVTIIVYQVKHRSIMAPNGNHVEFVAISIVRGEVLVDLISGSGIENSIRLSGDEAEEFLECYDMHIAKVHKSNGG